MPSTPSLDAAAVLGLLTLLPIAPAFSAEDLREKVQSPAPQPAADAVIDPAGAVFGVPFGASEDEVMKKFGKPIRLSDLKGRPILINFTATWCQPCRLEAPKLVEAYAKYKDRGFEILSVYLDSKDTDVAAYAKKLGATWPIRNEGIPFEGPTAMAYGIGAVPTNILVGKDRKILKISVRGDELGPAIEKSR